MFICIFFSSNETLIVIYIARSLAKSIYGNLKRWWFNPILLWTNPDPAKHGISTSGLFWSKL